MINQKIEDFSQNDSFSFYLASALGAHIALVLILIAIQWFAGINIFENTKKENVTVIQSAVRVDVVGMPKFTVQELKKMNVSPVNTVEEVGSEKERVDKIDSDLDFKKLSKKVDLNKLLNNLSQKENKKKSKGNAKDKIKDMLAKNKSLKSLVLEGNKISKGTSIVGDNLELENSLFNEYIANLPNLIRPNWKLPSYLIDQELKCRVRIFIAANGKILKTQIYESSGIDEFDEKALKALKASDPLPAPDKNILAKVAAGEVILGFPL